jgi:hypothetical protein
MGLPDPGPLWFINRYPGSATKTHHVKHWIDGGTTCLLNMGLLCQYHHTFVHQRDLTATVTAFGVTWQT